MGPERAGDLPKVTQPAATLGPEANLLPPHPVLWSLHEAISAQSRQNMERGRGSGFVQVPASGRSVCVGVCVLLPSRVGAIKQLEGAVLSEVPTAGWML